ncbi:MAG: thioredoxin family protein [Methanobrevibacter thaueri]|jgi:thioredoxin-related protein|uniref:thioredoxin family protein n=1 Tax=Methanobrevibacter thaueri TaxID=190975 RepID=UPI0026F2BD6A|nr:thioredoxin family protein [Methanobrevibacter thaueri]MBE6496541.1 thioredoxin family protein [Methanobrevibacter thaueri]
MKNLKIYFVAFLILVAAVSTSAVFSEDTFQIAEGLNATSNITQALDNATLENKTVMLVFDQDSCYYCDLFKNDVLSDENVQKELNEKYIVAVSDVNQEPQLAGQLRVVGTPTIVFLDSNASEINRIDGYLPADEFLDVIKEI